MAQSADLISTLKGELRRRGITYKHVAAALGLSESSVKRMFSTSSFTLERFQQICDLAGLELSDLAGLAEERRRDIDELSEEQERTLVEDPKLLLIAFLLLNYWTVADIRAAYAIGELEAVRLLARLDRLEIIDLLPGNMVRMRVSHAFAWRKNGPIQKLFERQIQSEFFRSGFDSPLELRLVMNGMISQRSIELIHQRMQRVMGEFEQCVREDRRGAGPERQGTTLVMAIRPWSLSLFEAFRIDR